MFWSIAIGYSPMAYPYLAWGDSCPPPYQKPYDPEKQRLKHHHLENIGGASIFLKTQGLSKPAAIILITNNLF
jgi:hypothetical protein